MGPSSENRMEELLKAGMDVARLNFSHGTHDNHMRIFEKLRTISGKYDNQVLINYLSSI